MLAQAEQIRAAQQLTDEQVGQLVRQTRSRTKTACTHAAPSARARHPAAAAEEKKARKAPASVILARRSRSRCWEGEGQQRRRAVEQRAPSYDLHPYPIVVFSYIKANWY